MLDGSDVGWLPQDAATFRAALAAPGADTAELARALGLSETDTRDSVERLATWGLLHAGERGRWVPAPPELVLGPVVARSRERLRGIEALVADLAEAYHRTSATGSGLEMVEVIEDADALGHRLLQLEFSAQRRVRAFQSGGNEVISPASTVAPAADGVVEEAGEAAGAESLEQVRVHGRPGVHYQFLVDADFLQEPASQRYLHQRLAEGDEVRVVDRPVRKLAIADDDVAMVQVGGGTTVMLRRPLVDLVVELFETLWAAARPYLEEGPDISPLDRSILQLMLAGLTDQAIAAQLATSARTVQRRVRALEDMTGSTTRMQLGWHASRRGWV